MTSNVLSLNSLYYIYLVTEICEKEITEKRFAPAGMRTQISNTLDQCVSIYATRAMFER